MFCTVFLLVIGLRVFCSQVDPSIEVNPGPSPTTNVIFQTNDERTCFNAARNVLTNIAKATSHRYFLQFCKSLDIIPRVLSTDTTFSVLKPSAETQQLLQQVRRSSHKEELNILIEHLNNVLPSLMTDKVQRLAKLAAACDSARYANLHEVLEAQCRSEFDKLMKGKEKKLDALIDTNRSHISKANSWIPELKLTTDHRTDIESNAEICDTITNAAMTLLQKLTPNMSR